MNYFKQINESFERLHKNVLEEDKLTELKESLKKIIRRLDEAPMSDEDKAESEILRNLYKKIDGKKPPKFTPEEQTVLDKYGLDAWGFRGDTKMITPGKNDVIKPRELGSHSRDWRGRKYWRDNKNADKINFADRARKTDSRDWGRKYNYYQDYYKQTAEREDQARQMQRPLNDFKYAKSDYNSAKKDLDDYYINMAKGIERADAKAIGSTIDDEKDLRYNIDREKIYDDKIKALLAKHSKKIESLIESLNEATSPEDKHDSDLLRGILTKLAKRSNTKLSPEELAVLKKYDFVQSGKGIYHRPSHNYYNTTSYHSQKPGSIMDPKYNFVGKLKKPENEYAKKVKATGNWWDDKEPFQDKERKLDISTMGQDVSDMKSYLDDRKYYRKEIDKTQKALDAERARRAKERDDEIARLTDPQRKKDTEDKFNKAKDKLNNIRRRYGLPTEESLKEGYYNAKYMNRIIPTYGDPKLNSEIIGSVLGQLSDGIWENTPGMEGYWTTAEADDKGNIVVDDRYTIRSSYGDRPFENKYSRMDDDEVRSYFANKAKYIAQLYLHYHGMNPYKNWNAENEEECRYMGGHILDHDPTIAEIYNFYKNNK